MDCAPSLRARSTSSSAPAAATHNASTAKQAVANLASASGSLVSGRLTLAPMGDGVHLSGEVGGLQPGSSHGFHIHEKGDCSAVDASRTSPTAPLARRPHRGRVSLIGLPIVEHSAFQRGAR